MKTKLIYLVSLIATLLASSCVNSDIINECDDCSIRVTPDSYLPGHPKTWWKYTDANGMDVIYRMSDEYMVSGSDCLPFLLNLNKGLRGNSIRHWAYNGQGRYNMFSSQVYSLSVGSVMICPVSFSTFEVNTNFIGTDDINFRRVTTNIDTSLIVNGTNYSEVIEVFEFNIHNENHRYLDYFAKDVGLIKRDYLDAADSTIHIQILGLEDYFIGN